MAAMAGPAISVTVTAIPVSCGPEFFDLKLAAAAEGTAPELLQASGRPHAEAGCDLVKVAAGGNTGRMPPPACARSRSPLMQQTVKGLSAPPASPMMAEAPLSQWRGGRRCVGHLGENLGGDADALGGAARLKRTSFA